MAAWTTLSDAVLSAGKAGIQSIFRALRDNTIAAFEKQAGAPVLANLYVVQGMLSTTTGIVSRTSPGSADVTLPGGEYGFWPQLRVTNSGGHTGYLFGDATGTAFPASNSTTTYLARAHLGLSTGSTSTAELRQRYILGSPPYEPFRVNDPVPLFFFGLLHVPTGIIHATYAALDPPWGNNGPTIINPLGRIRNLARLKMTLQLGDVTADRRRAVQMEQELVDLYDFMRDPRSKGEILAEMRRPIPQSEKNADMNIIPHPFLGNDLTNYQVILINPTDDRFCRGLAARQEYLGDSVADILTSGHLVLDNSPMPGLNTPPSVMAVRARWKLTP